jgi:pilus assembly protein CpaF
VAGYIISVIGGKGGVGKSQFAANLAFAYVNETRSSALLLDFDRKASGDQNYITGIKPKKTIKDIAEFSGNIDQRSILQFASTHPKKVSYIGLPNDTVATDSIDPENLGKLIKSVPNIYPLTVIDCGSDLGDMAIKALEGSTMIFLVVAPDILGLNQAKRLQSKLITMLFPKDMIQVVVNQFQKGHPVTAEVIGKTMGKPVFTSIRKDDQSCITALNRKQPAIVVAPGGPFSKDVTECARKIIQKNILKSLAKLTKSIEKPADSKAVSTEQKGKGSKGNTPWTQLKSRIHKALIDEMDMGNTDNDDPKAQLILREQTKKVVVELLGKEGTKGIVDSREQMNQMVKEILDEALGLGPLEDLLADAQCSEIMVVGPYQVYYEYGGKLKLSDVTFTNDRQVLNVIERIVAPIGRRIDEKTPYVDARLQDGSRVHAIIPPSSIDGCTITIRKFPEERLTYKNLVKFGSITQNMADFLRIAVEGHRNIVVSGGTGSGKTTLINVLGSFIQANERIITCEDSAELDFPQEHVVRLETRPPSLEGDGEITMRCLIKQTLRMRPNRIVVGECRGGETLDMLQAMGTGHDGSMTTVHSNNPRECIGRLETLVQYAGAGLGARAIREMIAGAVHIIIQASRLDDGSRKITHITEIGGMQGEVITLQDIFLYNQRDFDKNGKIIGDFQASGFIPKFIESLERKGINIPRGLFQTENPAVKPPPPVPKPAGPGGGKPPPGGAVRKKILKKKPS